MPSFLEVTHQITCHFDEAHLHSKSTHYAKAQMTRRQASLQQALSRAAANFKAGTETDPFGVAIDILADARIDMGEELWASLSADYPLPPL